MQLSINRFQVRQCDLLLEDHLVETDDEVGIQESPVEYTQPKTTTNKLEVVQVFGVHARRGIDLKGVIVMSRVFKQAIEWVEHFVREKEEEFPA